MSVAPKSQPAPASSATPMSGGTAADSPLKQGISDQMFATWIVQSGVSVISRPPSSFWVCDGSTFKCIWKDAATLSGKKYSLGMDMAQGVQQLGAAWLMGHGIRKVELTGDLLPEGFRWHARTIMTSLLAKHGATAQRRKSHRGPSLDAVRAVLHFVAARL